jgi:hypothetical protein
MVVSSQMGTVFSFVDIFYTFYDKPPEMLYKKGRPQGRPYISRFEILAVQKLFQ